MVRLDNSTVVQALNSNEGHSMVAAPVLQDCRNCLRDIGKVTIKHCSRESSIVAHELAKWGNENPPALWLEAPLVLFLSF